MQRFSTLTLPAILIGGLTAAIAGATQQAPVALGSNSTFAVLAGTTVTVIGGGVITGNIGISPGTAFIAGTPPVTVNGTIYRGGPVAAQAQADLTTAYNDAAGRQTPAIVSGNLGGQTLTPGLYKSTSSLAVSSGDLTLDAQGNANAVFIFQIGSTFTMTSGRQVILAGNANAANIFWQVGSSATLGTTTVLHGNILAAISISMLTGATLDGRALAQGGAVSIDTGGGHSNTVPAAPTQPTVTSTVPANGASGVPTSSKLSATFSTTMDSATITPSTFTLAQGSTPVTGAVTYSGTTAVFTPSSALAPNKTFTATFTTGAKDQAGNALASNYVWSFSTGVNADTTPLTVTSTAPVSGASSVPVNKKVSAVFSEAMDPSTLNNSTFTVLQGTTLVAGIVSYSGTTATFTPSSTLPAGTTFSANLSTGVKDLAGNALATPYTWSFTTGSAPDTTPPTVSSTTPADGATPVAVSVNFTATFSEPMDPLTITTATITLQHGATPVAGTVNYSGLDATFTPNASLAFDTLYTATISTGARDLAGNAMANPYAWSFTTGPAPAAAPEIYLGGTDNDANYVAPVAAGSVAAVFGNNLSPGETNSAGYTVLPTSLGQTSLYLGGQAAPLFYVSPGQVNVQIPWELAGQTEATVAATSAGAPSNSRTVPIAAFAPGLFTIDNTGAGQGAVLIAPTSTLAGPASPVSRGAYISIFGTGLGAVTNQPVTGAAALGDPLSFSLTAPTVTIGGVTSEVSFSGLAPGFVGLYQVNVVVPSSVEPGSTVPVILTIGGVASNTVTIAVQ